MLCAGAFEAQLCPILRDRHLLPSSAPRSFASPLTIARSRATHALWAQFFGSAARTFTTYKELVQKAQKPDYLRNPPPSPPSFAHAFKSSAI